MQAWTGHYGRSAYVLALCNEDTEVTTTVLLPPVRVSPKLLDELNEYAARSGSTVELWVNALLAEALLARRERAKLETSGGPEA